MSRKILVYFTILVFLIIVESLESEDYPNDELSVKYGEVPIPPPGVFTKECDEGEEIKACISCFCKDESGQLENCTEVDCSEYNASARKRRYELYE